MGATRGGRLFQETWRRRPFWMLVACIMVNRTRWEQARAVHARLVKECRDVRGLAELPLPYLEDMLRPLGLSTRRAESLLLLARIMRWRGRIKTSGRFTLTFNHLTADQVRRLPGCGKYAADSWAIFVEGHTFLKGVTDARLLGYQSRMRKERR